MREDNRHLFYLGTYYLWIGQKCSCEMFRDESLNEIGLRKKWKNKIGTGRHRQLFWEFYWHTERELQRKLVGKVRLRDGSAMWQFVNDCREFLESSVRKLIIKFVKINWSFLFYLCFFAANFSDLFSYFISIHTCCLVYFLDLTKFSQYLDLWWYFLLFCSPVAIRVSYARKETVLC